MKSKRVNFFLKHSVYVTHYNVKLNSYITSCISSAHKVTCSVNFQGGKNFNSGESIWNSGGGAHCWKHKFQGGIVFHGEETSVAPLAN